MNPETEEYIKKQAECGLKPGDWVRVIRAAENHEAGWNCSWSFPMRHTIGKSYEIIEPRTYNEKSNAANGTGILLHNGLWYPYFVLEKVNNE